MRKNDGGDVFGQLDSLAQIWEEKEREKGQVKIPQGGVLKALEQPEQYESVLARFLKFLSDWGNFTIRVLKEWAATKQPSALSTATAVA